jgi:hypothetical protein
VSETEASDARLKITGKEANIRVSPTSVITDILRKLSLLT